MRIAADLPRYLLYATCAAGLLASARFAVAPPRPVAPPPRRAPTPADGAAKAYAVLFARRYLTWDAALPRQSEEELAAMSGPSLDQDVGLTLPPSGSQHVAWAEAVQERTPVGGSHVYTIAAQTDAMGLVYMTVTVMRGRSGRLAIVGYPAFVGAPPSAPAAAVPGGGEVTQPGLSVVIERALRNYLADAPQELAADLAAGTAIAPPEVHLTLDSMPSLTWSSGGGRTVVALIDAHDARGAHYTLAYELDVEQVAGRWEISAIQTDPNE